MKKGWLVFLLVGISLVAVLATACSTGAAQGTPSANVSGQLPVVMADGSQVMYLPIGSSQQTGIWVNGQGKVTVVPDLAVLSLGVEAQATTVGEARQQAAAAMEAIMKSLADNGVDIKDIQTQQYSIYPVRTWNKDMSQEILIGYRVSNTITVKVRNLENAGRVIDDSVIAGGDLARFNSIYLTVDKPETYYDQAREQAIKDAQAKAQQMATLTGVTLGKPVYITESGSSVPFPVYKAAPVAGAADGRETITPITPGEEEIAISVQIVFAIQ